MSLLELLRDTPDEDKPPQRWIELLEDEPAIGAPKLEALIEYLSLDDFERMARPYKPRNEVGITWVQTLGSDDRRRLFKKFLPRVLKDLRGFGRKNLPRISAEAMKKKSALDRVDETIPFSEGLLDDLAVLMNFETFVTLYVQATNLNEFAVAVQEKND